MQLRAERVKKIQAQTEENNLKLREIKKTQLREDTRLGARQKAAEKEDVSRCACL